MGSSAHHVIVVSGWDKDRVESAFVHALRCLLQTMGPSESLVRGYWTLVIPPDGGSPSGYDLNAGRRDTFKDWLRLQVNDLGEPILEWAEIVVDRSSRTAWVTDHSWKGARVA